MSNKNETQAHNNTSPHPTQYLHSSMDGSGILFEISGLVLLAIFFFFTYLKLFCKLLFKTEVYGLPTLHEPLAPLPLKSLPSKVALLVQTT